MCTFDCLILLYTEQNIVSFLTKFWRCFDLSIAQPELKTLELDTYLNPDRLIWRLITRGEQALFNLEIKKKTGSIINPDIHHSKVFTSGLFSFLEIKSVVHILLGHPVLSCFVWTPCNELFCLDTLF